MISVVIFDPLVIRDLPDEMLTKKGAEELAKARAT